MKVIIKIDVSDELRRCLRHRLGHSGKATRREVAREVNGNWDKLIQDYLHEYRNDPDVRRKRARTLHNLGAGLGMRPKLAVAP